MKPGKDFLSHTHRKSPEKPEQKNHGKQYEAECEKQAGWPVGDYDHNGQKQNSIYNKENLHVVIIVPAGFPGVENEA